VGERVPRPGFRAAALSGALARVTLLGPEETGACACFFLRAAACAPLRGRVAGLSVS
jgi:hypothetical protein